MIVVDVVDTVVDVEFVFIFVDNVVGTIGTTATCNTCTISETVHLVGINTGNNLYGVGYCGVLV